MVKEEREMKTFSKFLIFISFTTLLLSPIIHSVQYTQAADLQLRAIPAPITDRGSMTIPEKVFPEGKGASIPIYVPPVVDSSNAYIKDSWKTVVELKGALVWKNWAET